jgi:HD-like signal output (HDOD) protein
MVLSGEASREDVMRGIGPTHRYLSKPCDAETLKAMVAHSFALRDLLTDEPLKRVVSQMTSLPSLPSLYGDLMTALEAKEPSLQHIGAIVGRDVEMTAKILQLVNSEHFGLRTEVTSPTQAISLLGVETLRALMLSVHVFSAFHDERRKIVDLPQLSRHSLATGALAKALTRSRGDSSRLADCAFTAGLLHDAGKVVLASSLAEAYGEVIALAARERLPLWQAEHDRFGCTHAEVGAYVLSLWGLPDAIAEAVAWHHRPTASLCRRFSAITAVHVANVVEHRWSSTPSDDLDTVYLQRVDPDRATSAWEQGHAALRLELGYAS